MFSSAVRCPRCGNPAKLNSAFCGQCGAKIEIQSQTNPQPTTPVTVSCPHCGTSVGTRYKFCFNCGSPITPATTSAGFPNPMTTPQIQLSPLASNNPTPTPLEVRHPPSQPTTPPAPVQAAPKSTSRGFCDKCGTQLRAESTFCPGCGTLVVRPQAVADPTTSIPQPANPVTATVSPLPAASTISQPPTHYSIGQLIACRACGKPFMSGLGQCPFCNTVVEGLSDTMNWQMPVANEPPEILELAIKAASSAGLVTKVSQYNYFEASGLKSPGKVLLGGLAYYLAASTDQISVRINKTGSPGSIVNIESRGLKGRQALNILAGNLKRPTAEIIA
jgi:hypothetical protein